MEIEDKSSEAKSTGATSQKEKFNSQTGCELSTSSRYFYKTAMFRCQKEPRAMWRDLPSILRMHS